MDGLRARGSIWSVIYPIGEQAPAWRSIPYGRPMVNQHTYVLSDALGETLSREFVAAKRSEWIAYARHVSDWEMKRYGELF